MIAAAAPVQRPPDARLLVVDAGGCIAHRPRADFAELLRAGDLVVANDAATLPASLAGLHVPTGCPIEVRLAGRTSLAPADVRRFTAIVFGAGDFHTRTEHRPAPPPLGPGDRLELGGLRASVLRVLQHPRLVELHFEGTPASIWEGLVRHGRPIQYAHVPSPLALWDTWTPIAGPPVAFEPPSAGFLLDWKLLAAITAGGAHFATITHAAGISSTGDPSLDALLPFDEPYRIPQATADLIRQTRSRGGRIVAIGTTVVRALEHAAGAPGAGVATQKIGATSRLHVVDAILSGTHEPGTSHHELLRAFITSYTLARMDEELEIANYRTHEFGDSIFLERASGFRGMQGACLRLDSA